MKTQGLCLNIESNLDNVSWVGVAVQQICLLVSLNETEAYQVQLGIVEAVNNVIKHAYGNEHGHIVTLDIARYTDKMVFTLTDCGKTRTAVAPESLDFDPDDIDALPESGMGLFIIQSVMDEVDYCTIDEKNIQTFVKYLAPDASV